MRIAIGTYRLAEPGGSESYALTVARELERLGHEPALTAVERGPFADFAQDAGVRVRGVDDAPSPSPDALISQDGVLAHLLSQRHPRATHLFVAHSPQHDLQFPPQIGGICDAVVALNDRIHRRVRAMAQAAPVIRLTQPIDLRRFSPGPPLPERPRRVLLLGNRLQGERREAIRAACALLGLECEQRGATSRPSVLPEAALRAADIVVGHGRAIVEAMACARAAYVYDLAGEDGWVTPEAYAGLERDGFAGGAFEVPFDPDRLMVSLGDYRREMGPANRDLARRWHNSLAHAGELVELIRMTGGPPPRPNVPNAELARLTRIQWQTESRGAGFREEARAAQERARAVEERARAAREEAALAGRRAEHAERRLRSLVESRSYRAARALAGVASLLRRRPRRCRGRRRS